MSHFAMRLLNGPARPWVQQRGDPKTLKFIGFEELEVDWELMRTAFEIVESDHRYEYTALVSEVLATDNSIKPRTARRAIDVLLFTGLLLPVLDQPNDMLTITQCDPGDEPGTARCLDDVPDSNACILWVLQHVGSVSGEELDSAWDLEIPSYMRRHANLPQSSLVKRPK